MRLDGVPPAIAWGVFASVCLAPFLFGAIERSVWIPLCQLWLGAGLASVLIRSRLAGAAADSTGLAVSRALLPLHALFLLQLVPLPAAVLRVVSPGSFAAHFLPDPGDGRFRPFSVSPSATIEAWLYFAGLQGLFLALRALPAQRRRALIYSLVGVILVLAGEGLWQSRSAHPAWLYSRIPILAPSGLDTATFGPYYNRNHFATVMALGAGLAAGLAAGLLRDLGGIVRLLSDTGSLIRVVALLGAAALCAITSAASGSRSGTLAAIAAIALISARALGTRLTLLPLGLGLMTLALSGAASIERLLRVDLMASRWAPWIDMTRLFPFYPLFGSGLGTFHASYWPHQTHVTYEFWQHAHNEYLQWLIEGGLAGGLLLLLAALRLSRRVTFRRETREAGLGALAAFGIQACLDFPFRIPANAALLVCILALALARWEQQGGPRDTPARVSP